MSDKIQHTPTPWVAEPCTNSPYSPWDVKAVISESEKEFICQTSGNGKANAELICKAVNNYSDLLKALNDLVEDCEGRCIPESAEDGYEAYHQATAVLAAIYDPQQADER